MALTDESASPIDRWHSIEGSLEGTAIQARSAADRMNPAPGTPDDVLHFAWQHVAELAADVLSLMDRGAEVWSATRPDGWLDVAGQLANIETCLAVLNQLGSKPAT